MCVCLQVGFPKSQVLPSRLPESSGGDAAHEECSKSRRRREKTRRRRNSRKRSEPFDGKVQGEDGDTVERKRPHVDVQQSFTGAPAERRHRVRPAETDKCNNKDVHQLQGPDGGSSAAALAETCSSDSSIEVAAALTDRSETGTVTTEETSAAVPVTRCSGSDTEEDPGVFVSRHLPPFKAELQMFGGQNRELGVGLEHCSIQ